MLLHDSKKVFFGESESAKRNMEGYPCHIGVAAPHYNENYVSFAFPNGSPYVALFSAKILKLKQGGEVDKLLHKYLSTKDAVTCDTSSYTTLGYENIFSAFVVLLAGAVAAWVILLGERMRVTYLARRRLNNYADETSHQ